MNNKNKTRIRYTKEFKRKAILDLINGKNPIDILKSSGFDLTQVLKNDKKYALKLVHQWKKEVYKNTKIINILDTSLDEETILTEIENLKDETDKDNFMKKYNQI